MKITFDELYYPNRQRDRLLEHRQGLLERIVEKDVEDQAILTSPTLDPFRFAYLQGIAELDRQLEAVGQAGRPEVDVAAYAVKFFREEDAEEQYWSQQ